MGFDFVIIFHVFPLRLMLETQQVVHPCSIPEIGLIMNIFLKSILEISLTISIYLSDHIKYF